MTTNPTPDVLTRRDAFYRELEPHAMAALWTRLRKLIPSEPTPAGVAHRWAYEKARPYLMESASLISAEEAERRVLLMENPGLPGTSCITRTMYAGLQLILPGEVAPAHRHTQSALRFIVEGSGAYTAVDGEKTYMEPGDFVITPAWTWHHHGHEGNAPMVWLDGLDIPIVSLFNGGFREEFKSGEAPVTRPAGDALARYGTGLMPVGYQASTMNSPVFNYPYARTREALFALPRAGAPDPHAGYLMRYTNPVDGGWAMPTIATMIRLLPSGFATLPYRSTDSIVFVCVEGSGHVTIGDQQLELAPHDVVVVPGWSRYTLHASQDLVLFSYSDRVAQEKLGLFREQRC
ncbi:gentisate 1,2-dioxygenase [Cupriavidus sp. L7L]|uniref:gentisate 1,2-dioxygenase n=1 Tax=Cupriavidus sp. L7L TaxID=2546443 RepID=UPI00105660D4|nr:gentisate 1,2-dioxygenase [Cupriavidus sp. L7L]TDF64003.1 gentisate 1,2-dioxygenase [Cupriavidus sp. L7L]